MFQEINDIKFYAFLEQLGALKTFVTFFLRGLIGSNPSYIFMCFFVIILQPYFFSYADPSEKFHFSNRYNFCSDDLFRLKSTKISILSGVLLLLAHKYSLRCLVSILDLKFFHLGRHRKKKYGCNWIETLKGIPVRSIQIEFVKS